MHTMIADIPIELTRKNIRTLRLTVRRDGQVCVSAPLFLSEACIENFVRDKRDWIETQRAKMAALPTPTQAQYVTGEPFVLFGRAYNLRVIEGRTDLLFLDETANEAVLTLRTLGTPERRGAFLREWRREALRQEIAQRLPAWEARTGLHSSDFSIRDMHTRWGSCNTRTGKIWFSLLLSEKSEESIDYVILHELCHLRIPNHGADFKALMDTYMPDWRERKKRLNT